MRLSLMIVLLQRVRSPKVKVLAPYGRISINQLLIAIGDLFRYFLWLRSWYVRYASGATSLVVAVIVTLQVLFSHWWLSKFLYGPMEWLWRAITYWKLPKFKTGSSLI